MMQVYLQRSGRCGEDLINAFSSRLHHHQTREEVRKYSVFLYNKDLENQKEN